MVDVHLCLFLAIVMNANIHRVYEIELKQMLNAFLIYAFRKKKQIWVFIPIFLPL